MSRARSSFSRRVLGLGSGADAFSANGDGRGTTWDLCHFRGIGGQHNNHSILVRFDCDLSLDVDDPEMKETDIFYQPEIFFTFGLSEKQGQRVGGAANESQPK